MLPYAGVFRLLFKRYVNQEQIQPGITSTYILVKSWAQVCQTKYILLIYG